MSENNDVFSDYNVKWNDDLLEEDGTETLESNDEEILQCANAVVEAICNNLPGDAESSLKNKVVINIKIPNDTHPLIKARYDNKWTMDSRVEQIMKLQERFESMVEEEKTVKSKINSALHKYFPESFVESVYIFDDDMTMGDELIQYLTATLTVQLKEIKSRG